MNKKFLFVSILAIIATVACKKNADYTPNCSGTTPSFSSTVSPLIQARCATSGCHDSGSRRGPGALTTYSQIAGNKDDIYASVASGSMPEGSTLTDAQKDQILCWINGGAPNN